MTEMGASPERQGWFAGLKAKVSKELSRFTMEGAKKNFYEKNADIITRATANLSDEDKQKAYAMIEQDAQFAAKTDVALHWGTAVVGTAAATVGLGALTNRGREFMTQHGGGPGKFIAERGAKASELFGKVFKRGKRVELVGSSAGGTGLSGKLENLEKMKKEQEAVLKASRSGDLSRNAAREMRQLAGQRLAGIRAGIAETRSQIQAQGAKVVKKHEWLKTEQPAKVVEQKWNPGKHKFEPVKPK